MLEEKKYNLLSPEVTVEMLIEAKRKGYSVRRVSPFGLTVEKAGRVYSINGYRVIVKGDWKEIEKKLREGGE